MTNDTIRRQMGLSNGPGGADNDDGGLPWLEPAPDPDRGTLSFKSLAIIGTIFLLVFIAFLAIFYNRIAGTGGGGSTGPGGAPTLIAAPIGPFKVTEEQAARGDIPGSDSYNGEPRFAERSEQPVTGAERLERAAREGGGQAIELDTDQEEPLIGYVRPIKQPKTEEAKPPAEEVREAVEKVEPPKQVEQPVERVAEAPKRETPKPPVVTPPKETVSAPSGRFLLQLGAFSTRDSAMNGWNQYSKTYPGSLAGLAPDLQSFQNAAGKTLYRLRAAGLDTRAAADERCAALKAAKQACFVVER